MTDYATIGRKKLLEIDGEAGVRVEETLNGICPDLARYLIEYSFGEIYAREILDNTTKEQAVVAALTAMGTAAPQLKVHIHAALHVGCSPEEIREIIIQMCGYAGFPATLNAMGTLMEVLKETGRTLSKESVHAGFENRYGRGKECSHRSHRTRNGCSGKPSTRSTPISRGTLSNSGTGTSTPGVSCLSGAGRWRRLRRLLQKARPPRSSGSISAAGSGPASPRQRSWRSCCWYPCTRDSRRH